MKRVNCFICMDSGLISYDRAINGHIASYVARCSCQAGERFNKLFPAEEVLNVAALAAQNREYYEARKGEEKKFSDLPDIAKKWIYGTTT